VKTEESERMIDLGPAVMAELKKWKLACPKNEKNELNLVFPSKTGTPIDHHHLVARHFAPTLKEAKLPGIRYHDLRHTFASLLIAQGENIKRIQTMLGHSRPTVTLDIYSHLIEPSNQEAARRLEGNVLG
jgi:integrase